MTELGAPLTESEKAVFALIAAGLMNKQIAYMRGISDATVKRYAGSIFTKLGVESRTAAALIWHGVGKDQIDRAIKEGTRP